MYNFLTHKGHCSSSVAKGGGSVILEPYTIAEFTTNDNITTLIRDTDPDYYTAQQFPAAASGNLLSIDLMLYRLTTTCLGDMTISIQADNADEPDGTDLSILTIDVSTLGTSNPPPLVNYTFDAAAAVTGSDKYWFVFKEQLTSALGSTGTIRSRIDTAQGYTDGLLKYTTNAGTNWQTINQDIRFKVSGEN